MPGPSRAGTLGDAVHPCPVDRRCLTLLGIDVETLGDVVARSADDAEVLLGLRAVGIPPAEAAWFDAPAWEDALQEMVWRSDGETISDRDERNVMILHAEEAVTVTWSRYSILHERRGRRRDVVDGPELRVVADRFRVEVTVPGGAAPVSYCRI
jgi:hypothetical protein